MLNGQNANHVINQTYAHKTVHTATLLVMDGRSFNPAQSYFTVNTYIHIHTTYTKGFDSLFQEENLCVAQRTHHPAAERKASMAIEQV